MLIFDPQKKPDDPAFDTTVARLKALIADIEAVQAGYAPTVLPDSAPLLERWSLAQRAATCLIGRSSGHPNLPGEGREIVTSELWMISTDRQWARTLSRWYRLGEPKRKGGHTSWYQ